MPFNGQKVANSNTKKTAKTWQKRDKLRSKTAKAGEQIYRNVTKSNTTTAIRHW